MLENFHFNLINKIGLALIFHLLQGINFGLLVLHLLLEQVFHLKLMYRLLIIVSFMIDVKILFRNQIFE